MKNNIIRPESILLLKEEKYYLFADLGRILDLNEEESFRLKDFIMKSFWLDKLQLIFFTKKSNVLISGIDSNGKVIDDSSDFHVVDKKIIVQILVHHQFIEITRKNHSEDNLYKKLSILGWNLFDRILRANSGDFWANLIIQHLSIEIDDLRAVLRLNGLLKLNKLLPPTKKIKVAKKPKMETQTRNQIIFHEYLRKKSENPKISDLLIAKEIAIYMKMSVQNVKSIICRKKI
jgi:hypothetical protein